MRSLFTFCLFSILLFSCKRTTATEQKSSGADEPQYLIFQLFTYNPDADRQKIRFDSLAISNELDSILRSVDGNRGDGKKRLLGFAIGPLCLDLTDAEMEYMIRVSFHIAETKNIAVVFHIDDSMFWLNRQDLWSDPKNVEWSDWSGTVLPHRYISWAPDVLAPQMCYNSPAIKNEVGRIARNIIGAVIVKGINELKAQNKELLFGGVIAGWETQLPDYRYIDKSDTVANHLNIPRVQIGFNALEHLGYNAGKPPASTDSVLERVVHDYADYWAECLMSAGISRDRIYTHIAFPCFPDNELQMIQVQLTKNLGFPANFLAFTHTMPRTAFNSHSRPGFSTYPTGFEENNVDGILSKIIQELPNYGDPHWASSEGTNVQVALGASDLTWHNYLANMYRNGASLVNIYGWESPSVFGRSTQSPDAIVAYKQFLLHGF